MTNSLLRALVDLRNRQIQKARIQFGNRVDAIEREVDDPADSDQYKIAKSWYEQFETLEKLLDEQIGELVEEQPLYAHVSAVKGVGPLLAAQMMAMIDVSKAPYVSSLWKFAGFAPGYDRLEKGKKAPYNTRLRLVCYKVATSFMRLGSPYRAEYDRAREHYEETHPDWTDGHKNQAAKRKMMKLFLSHYWERARQVRGLETRRVYVQEHLGHNHISKPEDYGWPEWDGA